MRINTRLKSLELTVNEHRTLSKAKELLFQIAKHGDGELADIAKEACDAVGAAALLVTPVESMKEVANA